jgi:hypothetical protein
MQNTCLNVENNDKIYVNNTCVIAPPGLVRFLTFKTNNLLPKVKNNLFDLCVKFLLSQVIILFFNYFFTKIVDLLPDFNIF